MMRWLRFARGLFFIALLIVVGAGLPLAACVSNHNHRIATYMLVGWFVAVAVMVLCTPSKKRGMEG